ncbi:hypothetical protein K3495_g15087 [Podosphaera aphanis]|nr:hypothetical protein K3495_g15087 [Podosphaera aphanis]
MTKSFGLFTLLACFCASLTLGSPFPLEKRGGITFSAVYCRDKFYTRDDVVNAIERAKQAVGADRIYPEELQSVAYPYPYGAYGFMYPLLTGNTYPENHDPGEDRVLFDSEFVLINVMAGNEVGSYDACQFIQ